MFVSAKRVSKTLHNIQRIAQSDGLKGEKRAAVDYIHFIQDAVTLHWPNLYHLFYRRPWLVSTELTNDCNLKCKMCFRGKRRAGVGYMDFDLFKRVVDEAAQIGDVTLSLFLGGEPTLHPQFDRMVEYAMSHRKRLYVGFNTNGMLMNKRRSELIVRSGVDYVIFSLEGIGSLNDNIRLGSIYEVVERNILDLLDIRGNRTKPRVSTNTVVSVQSDSELQAIYDKWHGKLDAVSFNPCFDENFGILNWSTLRRWNPGYKLRQFCPMPFYDLHVLWNGDVTYCFHDLNGEGYVGNAYDYSLMDIWRGNKIEAIRQGILFGKKVGLCSKCMKFNNEDEKVC
jgi:MoaA/NifB/PqqE/SkfB family radical SAM enzyme